MKEKIQIGIMGGAGQHGNQNYEKGILKAYEIGKRIAEHKAMIITGATTGLPYAAVLGAKDAGGKTIGVSPAKNAEDHVLIYNKPLIDDYIHFTGRGLVGREIENVAHCTGIIVIGGGTGTMTEMGIASQAGMPIGGLTHIGGISDTIPENQEVLGRYGSIIVYAKSPNLLVDETIKASGKYLSDPSGLAIRGHEFLFGLTREELSEQITEINGSLEELIEKSSIFGKDVREILKEIRKTR